MQIDSNDTYDVRKDILCIPRDQNGFLPLSEVSNIIRLNRSLLQGIENLREEIIRKVIKDEYYITIQRRIYYYSNYPPDDGFTKPKESCISYLARRLFSYRPPSYYYDHKPLNSHMQLDETLYVIRKRYGYSSRPDRYSSVSLSNYNNNSRHNSAANYSHTLRSRASTSILNKLSIKPDKNHSISTTMLNAKTPVKSRSIINESLIYNNEMNHHEKSSSNHHESASNHNLSTNNMKFGKCSHISVKIVPVDGNDEEQP